MGVNVYLESKDDPNLDIDLEALGLKDWLFTYSGRDSVLSFLKTQGSLFNNLITWLTDGHSLSSQYQKGLIQIELKALFELMKYVDCEEGVQRNILNLVNIMWPILEYAIQYPDLEIRFC